MSVPDDLIEQARHLARREPRRPRQASLRRAVSAAYYALFHSITRRAGYNLLMGGSARSYRPILGRMFEHAKMKDAALKHRNARADDWLVTNAAMPLSADLRQVADAFLQLQAERHRADYDLRPSARFTRSETNDLVELAEDALAAWQRVSPDEAVRFVLACLGAGRR